MDITSGSTSGIFGALSDQSGQRQQIANSAISAGATRIQLKDYDGAIREFKRATGYDPTSTRAYTLMAKTYDIMGDHDNAVRSYENAVRTAPTDPSVRLDLARAYYVGGRVDDAEREFQKIARQAPGDPTASSWLGNLYLNTGRYAEAETQFQNEVRLSPSDPGAHHDLGMVYQAMGDHERALREFDTATSIDSNYAPGYADAGYSYLALDQPDSAQRMIDRLDAMGTDESKQLSNDLQLAAFTPEIAYTDPSKSTFLPALGPGTTLASLDPALATPGASKVFSLTFGFNQAMDPASVQNPLSWQISKSWSGPGGIYNNGLSGNGKDVSIPMIPQSVSYDPKTGSATVYFRITQNATGDGVIDPSHWVFQFRGTDVSGHAMDKRGDQYDGAHGGAF